MALEKTEPARILVVDDNKDLANTLVEYLSRLGHKATAAYGGREGLSCFRDSDFDMVITDLKMPDLDGMELLVEIKALQSRAIVLVITGYGTIDEAVKAIENGAYDFISKPFELRTLEVIVNRALDRHAIGKKLIASQRLMWATLICAPLSMIICILVAYFFFRQ